MIGLTLAFPIPAITIVSQSDRGFQDICMFLYGQDYYPVMKPDGIIFGVGDYKPDVPYAPFACAYADGSIGVQDSDEISSSWRWGKEKRASPSLPKAAYTVSTVAPMRSAQDRVRMVAASIASQSTRRPRPGPAGAWTYPSASGRMVSIMPYSNDGYGIGCSK